MVSDVLDDQRPGKQVESVETAGIESGTSREVTGGDTASRTSRAPLPVQGRPKDIRGRPRDAPRDATGRPNHVTSLSMQNGDRNMKI